MLYKVLPLSSSSPRLPLSVFVSQLVCLHLFLCIHYFFPQLSTVAAGFVLRQCGSDGQWGPWRDHSQCENPENNGTFQVRRREGFCLDVQGEVKGRSPRSSLKPLVLLRTLGSKGQKLILNLLDGGKKMYWLL